MSAYSSVVKTEKNFTNNVVIQIDSTYFAIRQPDSGLSISSPYDKTVMSLQLNPTTIDIEKVGTTISTFSFKILDKNNVITALIMGDASPMIGKQVRIFIGRSNEGMAFSDYYELPRTFVLKCDHSDNGYNFSSSEQTQRIDKPVYDVSALLGVDILAGTTTWTMTGDLTSFPSSGFLKVDDEFVSYTGVDLINNQFDNVVRGELNTTPAAHTAFSPVVLVQTVTDNPLSIILKLLISGGGGGTYDVLQSGLGISNTLIDVTAIETLRDSQFVGVQYTLTFYSIDSALKTIEDELLMPNNLRFTNSSNSKLSLALLDRAIFIEEDAVIDEDSITKFPQWSVDGAKVLNVITVNWDFNQATQKYVNQDTYQDASSIAAYGAQAPLVFNFSGIKTALNGQALVDDFGQKLLARLSLPTPRVQINTQLDNSLNAIGDKVFVESVKIPASDGTLNFGSLLEVLSRSINLTNGDVMLTLAFTSFTNIRSGFIAPSDSFVSVISQKKVTVGAGRGAYYKVGFVMALWNNVTQVYESDPNNPISDVTGDTITFTNNFSTTLVAVTHKMRFATYDNCTDSQKRYCFIDPTGATVFTSDNKPIYKVTY